MCVFGRRSCCHASFDLCPTFPGHRWEIKRVKPKTMPRCLSSLPFRLQLKLILTAKSIKSSRSGKGTLPCCPKVKGLLTPNPFLFNFFTLFIYSFWGSREIEIFAYAMQFNGECAWRLKSFQYCANKTVQQQTFTHTYIHCRWTAVCINYLYPWSKNVAQKSEGFLVIHEECEWEANVELSLKDSLAC